MKERFIESYQAVRRYTESLCSPLEIEDYVVQSIEDVSPPKWHLAHTTWFFETFILIAQLKKYRLFHPEFHYLFNSYYQTLGNFHPRIKRGVLSRPTVKMIYDYRKYVDQHILNYIQNISEIDFNELQRLLILGLHHEQQHQELLLMDIKHNFSINPDFHFYPINNGIQKAENPITMEFTFVEGGVVNIGHPGLDFCFDNESPQHQQLISPYLIATRLVTNAEYEEFVNADGYKKPRYWLSDAWECIQKQGWEAPLYWKKINNKWYEFTLAGMKELDPFTPVSHLSYFEADAYARWCNKRLPSEAEWENYVITNSFSIRQGNFLENGYYHPLPAASKTPQQFFGDLWEWTASAYLPYPGYKATAGSLGEYNGKFMNNQFVLKGGSCITPQNHIRATYRNFFQPDKRWQFSGIRLASNIE
jgi:ergothioneine biosynthesis protein EgtB